MTEDYKAPRWRDAEDEWLEADGLGGFASGTVGGTRTRRYHALLLASRRPPTERIVLVNGFDAWVETEAGRYALSAQRYEPSATDPDGGRRIREFEPTPWPRWTFALEDGTLVEQEICVRHGSPLVVIVWRAKAGTLTVRPFLSGRDYHALHHENDEASFDAAVDGEQIRWHTYESVPAVAALSNGSYAHDPHWYRNFLYEEERRRGFEATEDLVSPGTLTFDLAAGDAVLVLGAETTESPVIPAGSALTVAASLRVAEKARRAAFPSRLHRSADDYLVRRGERKTIVAGYPWFADWGRDTFIALRGLCLTTGRLAEARDVLVEWAATISQGMLPNRFPDQGGEPEYNAVDASLWYVIAVHEYLEADRATPASVTDTLRNAVEAILAGYAAGTRHGIRMDADGLLAAGEPGVQLTWMDARVDGREVTPRVGKPVELQALWINALRIGGAWSERWLQADARAHAAFKARFWNDAEQCLYDVVDVWHEAGRVDASVRPNQIFAIGGLPFPLLSGKPARRVVEAVESRLLTPLGLRSLARDAEGYAGRYEGDSGARDGAYHQGTVWPWLLGAFTEAWLRVHGNTAQTRNEARTRFLEPLLRHLDEAGLGHISEIADGDAPHTPRGAPFQAWSVGEALRLELQILAPAATEVAEAGGAR